MVHTGLCSVTIAYRLQAPDKLFTLYFVLEITGLLLQYERPLSKKVLHLSQRGGKCKRKLQPFDK